MTIRRMDNVGIVFEDLAAAIAFFTELGLELEGQTVEGIVSHRLLRGGVIRQDRSHSDVARNL